MSTWNTDTANGTNKFQLLQIRQENVTGKQNKQGQLKSLLQKVCKPYNTYNAKYSLYPTYSKLFNCSVKRPDLFPRNCCNWHVHVECPKWTFSQIRTFIACRGLLKRRVKLCRWTNQCNNVFCVISVSN